MAADWTLVTVAPNTERKVKMALERLELEHHIFRHREFRINHGKRRAILALTFPRYVFCTLADCWHIAKRVDDVIAPVRFGEMVARLPTGTVESLVASCVGEDILPALERPAAFHPGERVVVVGSHAMCGQPGAFVRSSSFGRCLVELELFGRLELEESFLRPLNVVMPIRQRRKRKRHRSRSSHPADSRL
jgi:Transcription termination factor nusG